LRQHLDEKNKYQQAINYQMLKLTPLASITGKQLHMLMQLLNMQSHAFVSLTRRHEMQQSKQYTDDKSYITDNNKL
jgi:hypothetical protein